MTILETLDAAGKEIPGCDWSKIRPHQAREAAEHIRKLEARVAAMPPEPEAFNLTGHVERVNSIGDVRAEFARHVERSGDMGMR